MVKIIFAGLLIPYLFAQVRGDDDRLALSRLTGTPQQAAGLIAERDGFATGPNWMTLRHANFGDFWGMCEGERLTTSRMVRNADCSLTLVAPDIAVTAAHCLMNETPSPTCHNRFFMFGITQTNLTTRLNIDEHLRACGEVLATGWTEESQESRDDWAIVRLNQPLNNVTPVSLASPGLPRVGETVSTVGTPQGIPSVQSRGTIDYVDPEGRGVRTDMDIVGGNSGGGVFNANGELIGVVTTSYDAQRIYYYEPSGCARWANANPRQEPHDGDWVTANGFVPIEYFRSQLDAILQNGFLPQDNPPPTEDEQDLPTPSET